MTVESADTIDELNASWPLGSDPKSEGDNHLRLIKDVMQKDAVSQARTSQQKFSGPVRMTATLSVENSGGNIFQKNTDIAAALGLWSTDVSGTGTFQITPRDNAGAVISGGGGLQITRNAGGVIDLAFAGSQPANIPPTNTSVIWRARGDQRYTLATSSARYKDEIDYQAVWPGVDDLHPASWIWGGELAEDDPRRGHPGFGLVAEDVVAVLPDGVTYDQDGRPEGVNLTALVGLLVEELKRMKTRLAVLEAR